MTIAKDSQHIQCKKSLPCRVRRTEEAAFFSNNFWHSPPFPQSPDTDGGLSIIVKASGPRSLVEGFLIQLGGFVLWRPAKVSFRESFDTVAAIRIPNSSRDAVDVAICRSAVLSVNSNRFRGECCRSDPSVMEVR